MADLFSITAPVMLILPDQTRVVLAEWFPHPDGVLFFELYWNQMPNQDGIHLLTGEVKGEGPWRVGDCTLTLIGCQGTHPEQANEVSEWHSYLSMAGEDYPSDQMIEHIARQHGAEV